MSFAPCYCALNLAWTRCFSRFRRPRSGRRFRPVRAGRRRRPRLATRCRAVRSSGRWAMVTRLEGVPRYQVGSWWPCDSLPPDFASNYSTLRTEIDRYNKESQQYRLFKTYMLLSFSLLRCSCFSPLPGWRCILQTGHRAHPGSGGSHARSSRGNFAYHVEPKPRTSLALSYNRLTR